MKQAFEPAIDFIRFIAFLLVFIRHFILSGGGGIANNEQWWSYEGIQRIAEFGGQGVSLFFGLTGFLISRLLIREFNDRGTIDVKSFYFRRILRIWPLYFVFILLCGLLNILSKSSTLTFREIPYLLTFSYNWGMLLDKITGSMASITWSISIEEQIYLVFPLLFILFAKNLLKFAISMICIGVFSTLACLYILSLDPHRFTFVYLISFSVGLIVALYETNILTKIDNRWLRFSSILLVISYAIFYREISSFELTLTYLLSALLFPSLYFSIKSLKLVWRNFLIRSAVYIGRRSYGCYLFHWVVWAVMIGRGPAILFNQDGFTQIGVLCSFAITIAISSISYKFLESPFLNYRKRFQKVSSP